MTESINVWQTVQSEFSCDHECSQIVRFTKANGAVCVREQCWRCGAHIKEVPKKGHDIDSLPEWNGAIQDLWNRKREKRREELFAQQQAEFEQERQDKNDQWWSKYNQYLRSQQWNDIRQKVLQRDGNVCQACLKNKAAQVHHVSYGLYDQIGRSAAFELVAVCYSCHKLIHPHMAEAQHELAFYNPYLSQREPSGNHGRK